MNLIVIPCYNEARRLEAAPFAAFLEGNPGVRFVFVDDGSTDTTAEKLAAICDQTAGRAKLIRLADNLGKAEAVRRGVQAALRDAPTRIGYWDGDLATPLSEIPGFIRFAEDGEKKMIFGSRIQRLGADIKRHWYRHYPGRMIAVGINLILKLPIHDTQCGAKLIDADLAGHLFAEPFVSSWLFDVELFARVIAQFGRKQAAGMIYEVPLQRWEDVGESKIALSYLPKIPVELVRIYLHYRKSLL